MDRIKWEEYFMAQSHLLALRSTCERFIGWGNNCKG
ncbi:dCMP deaminase [Staphylococcus gallinarum]|uniref:dCMP deaminase n=1 Tax=Staphylococcus gallinarum TaxID=1293 RepID=A0A380FIP9_STAGA|nr:dCMP deaminase [Staphylococcus gallinarum]